MAALDPTILQILLTFAVEPAISQFLDVLREPSEQARLQQVVQRAVARTFQPYSESIGSDLTAHLDSALNSFLMSGGLVPVDQAVASGQPVDHAEFQLALENRGFDAAPLGVPADEILEAFAANFREELRLEARRSESPLTNRVVVDGLERLLVSITGTVAVSDLQTAISVVSRPVLNRLNPPYAVDRPAVQQKFDEFLASEEQILLVTGQAGTGKSVASAIAVQRWSATAWTVLAVSAAGLSLTDTAQAVSAKLQHPPIGAGNWRRVLIQPWESLAAKEPGLAIYVDALDAAQMDQRSVVIDELVRLINEIGGLPADRVKLVLSCESGAWIRMRPFLPFGQQGWSDEGKSASSLTIGDFSETELDQGLALIGAKDFQRVDRPRGMADPHVDAMRQIFLHPATFGLFAELEAEQQTVDPAAATTADLAQALANRQIAAASALCQTNRARISAFLVKVAELALSVQSTDFVLSVETLQQVSSLSGIDFDSLDPRSSMVSALADRGVIVLRGCL